MSNHSLDGTKSLVSEASAADSIWLAWVFTATRRENSASVMIFTARGMSGRLDFLDR
jgi:hypothetical protein